MRSELAPTLHAVSSSAIGPLLHLKKSWPDSVTVESALVDSLKAEQNWKHRLYPLVEKALRSCQ